MNTSLNVRVFACAAVLFAAMNASSARAVLLLDETFSYPDGSILTQNGGTAGTGSWTSAWTDGGNANTHFQMQSGRLTSLGTGGTGAVQRTFSTTAAPGSTLYFAYDMEVAQNNEGQFQTFMEFLSGTVRMGVFDDTIRVDLGAQNGAFTPALNNFTGTFQLVGRLQFNQIGSDEVLTFWIDPTSEFDAAVATLQTDIGSLDLGSVISFTKANQESNIIRADNFLLGTDFDFTPFVAPPAPIPEPSSFVLLTGALLMCLRRRARSCGTKA